MIVYILFGIGIIAALIAILYGLRPMILTGRYKGSISAQDVNKSLSVIVYADNLNDTLREYIASLMQQEYPNFKAIIVCNATAESAVSFSEEYKQVYENLYFTFIPPGSHNLSRHKLAYTVGIKAADSEIVLTTNSACEIPSGKWLSEMMQPFNASEETVVVLGYTTPDFRMIKSLSRWFRQFDFVCTSSQWIGYALMRHPYRGDGNNLAFKRELFFEQKGYSSSNFTHGGDDDMFVSEIANGRNTEVVLSKETLLTSNWGIATSGMLSLMKERYRFTSAFLDKSPKCRNFVCSLTQWIALLCFAIGILFAIFCSETLELTVIRAGIGFLFILLTFGIEIYLYRRCAEVLAAVRLWWGVPVFMLYRLINNFIFNLKHRKTRYRNYTWERK